MQQTGPGTHRAGRSPDPSHLPWAATSQDKVSKHCSNKKSPFHLIIRTPKTLSRMAPAQTVAPGLTVAPAPPDLQEAAATLFSAPASTFLAALLHTWMPQVTSLHHSRGLNPMMSVHRWRAC